MMSFTIIKSDSSSRYYIYNENGTKLAQIMSLELCLKYFYNWCVKLNSKSVTFTPTCDYDVIHVTIY